MTITNGYTTLALLKAYVRVTTSDSSDDALLEDLVERASRVIDAHTRRRFYATTETRKYNARGPHIDGLTLYLDDDLVSVTSITNGDSTALASTDYVLLPANVAPKWAVQIKTGAGITWTYTDNWEQAISIAGAWGYNTTGAYPSDIEHACIRLATMFYRQKDSQDSLNQVAVSAEGIPLIPGGLPRDIREMLRPYVRSSL